MVLPNRISMVQIISCLRFPSSFPSTFPWEHGNNSWRIRRGKALYVRMLELAYWTMFWKTQVQVVFWLLNFTCTKGLQIDSLKHIMDLLLEYFTDSTSGPWMKLFLCLIEKDLHSRLSGVTEQLGLACCFQDLTPHIPVIALPAMLSLLCIALLFHHTALAIV